jgi:hypothetical protein
MRKLQNPPKDGPERIPESHAVKGVWKAALLLGAAVALKPEAADAQYIPPPPPPMPSMPMQGMPGSMGFMQSYDMRAPQAADVIYRSHHPSDSYTGSPTLPSTSLNPAEREALLEQLRPLMDDVNQSIKEIKANISSTLPVLQRELSDGTETGKKLAEIKIELLDLVTSLISRLEARANIGSVTFTIPQITQNAGVGSRSPAAGLSSWFFAATLNDPDNLSAFATNLKENATDSFSIVSSLYMLMTPEELASFTEMIDSFRALEAEYRGELSGFASDYIFLGPLLMLTSEEREKVIDFMLNIVWPDAFSDLPLQDQATVIGSILSGTGIGIVDVAWVSAAVALSRVGWERGSDADTMMPIDMLSDTVSMMEAASSFLNPEEMAAFRQFWQAHPAPQPSSQDGMEDAESGDTSLQPPVSPPAPIVQDDSSNPFLLASNYIFRGPLAQLNESDREKIIHYLAGNTPRITNGFAGFFSQMPPDKQYGAVLITLMESGVNLGNMDVGLSAAAAVLSHLGTVRGASPEVMQAINSPVSMETMMNTADSFLTPEESAALRQSLGIAAQPQSASASPQ